MHHELTLAPEVRGSLSIYHWEGARLLGVDAFVTDRFGGVSLPPYDSLNLGDHVGDRAEHVQENRTRVARAIGASRFVLVRQVHGADVVDASTATSDTLADIIVTDHADIGIAVLVADCVPLLLVDQASLRICVANAGWRGLASRVISNAVRAFNDPRTVHAFIGPCISAEAYQVGPEVAAHFGEIPGAVFADVGDRSRVDLGAIAVHQLASSGIDILRITRARQSTDGGETFFSDRTARPCGRFALAARRVLA